MTLKYKIGDEVVYTGTCLSAYTGARGKITDTGTTIFAFPYRVSFYDGYDAWITEENLAECVVGQDGTVPTVVTPEYTGGSVSYYAAPVTNPISGGDPYIAECNDIIEALGMTFAEGNAFKAIWRLCAARTLGKVKTSYKNGVYDAEKVVFFGERMVVQEKAKAGEQ